MSPSGAPGLPALLHLAHDLGGGGLERVAVNLSNQFALAGYPVHLGTWADPSRDFYESLVDDAVQRVHFTRPRRRGSRTPPARAARRALGIWDLARYVRRHRISIVHAHNASTLRLAVAARRFTPGVSVVWHHHDGDPHRCPPRPVCRAAMHVDHVVVVSDDLVGWASKVVGIDPAKVTMLPNTVAPSFLESAEHESGVEASRDELGAVPGSEASRIVCVANFRVEKGHRTVVRAMAQVAAADPRAHLLLVGSPSEPVIHEAAVEAIAAARLEERVTVLGQRTDVASILLTSAIGILGSSYEGCPLALLEYGAAGLAAVATDVGQCPEILDHGRAGTLVAPGDPDALGAAILAYLGDADLRAAHGAALRARVEARYRQEAVVEALRELYRRFAPTPERAHRGAGAQGRSFARESPGPC
ncbi:MAG TPA: glycosyltransferase family 4 protein [Acidimicrobiia bacterium]|nr:glycosyltransferase family 4 protein [Acidimicrobiia bacterium]